MVAKSRLAKQFGIAANISYPYQQRSFGTCLGESYQVKRKRLYQASYDMETNDNIANCHWWGRIWTLKHYLQEDTDKRKFIRLLVGLLIYLTNIWFIAHNGLEYGKNELIEG